MTDKEIYSPWGEDVKIVADHGQVVASYLNGPARLVTIQYKDGRLGKQFIHNLKAEGGINTLEAAADAAEEVTLDPPALKLALIEAE